MLPIRIFVATRDGQSERIAQEISRVISNLGIEVLLHVISLETQQARTPDASLIVVVAAVRYGRHLPEAESFLALFNKNHLPPPLVLISVNLRRERRAGSRQEITLTFANVLTGMN